MRLPNGEDKIQQCTNYVKKWGVVAVGVPKLRSRGILFKTFNVFFLFQG